MISGEALKRLAALRLAPEDMAEVLSIIADMQASDDARKAKQRARTAKFRDKNVTVTLQKRDCNDNVTVTDLPNKESPHTPKEINPTPQTSSLRSDDGGAVAEPAAPMTAKSRLWAEGVPILETFGLSKQARGLIGRWLKQTHDDAFPILDAIQRARDHGVVDAVPWITASLANPRQDRRNDRSNNVSDAFDRIKARLDGRTDPASDGLERDDGYSAGRPVPGFAGRLL